MKSLMILGLLTISSLASAASSIECNNYPLPLSVRLELINSGTFEGFAQSGYYHSSLVDCKSTNANFTLESINCKGSWLNGNEANFNLTRQADGTFKGVITGALGRKAAVLGCLVKG